MQLEEVAERQLAYPTVTEGVGMAAQKIVRELGTAPMPPALDEHDPLK